MLRTDRNFRCRSISPPGVVFDMTESYMGSFIINAVCYFIDSMLCVFIVYLNKKQPAWCFPKSAEEVSLLKEETPTKYSADDQ